jgi:hypothetical protein
MPRVHHLLQLLASKMGQPYDLHEQVPPWHFGWSGPWNCSTLVAWGLWQAGDYQLFGCRPYSPPGHHATFPSWWKVGRLWAWTEWFYEDLRRYAERISEDAAANTPGAIALYRPRESSSGIGHIAISLGNDRIIEAHGSKSSKSGVMASRSLTDRGFRHFYMLRNFKPQGHEHHHRHHCHRHQHVGHNSAGDWAHRQVWSVR